MLAVFAFLLRLPREVCYLIEPLVLDNPILDMAHEYQIVDAQGIATLTAISNHSYRPDRQLAYRMLPNPHRDYKKGLASHLSNLLEAHCQGRVKHVGTVLRINLHALFGTRSFYLGRAKKVIMLALQLHMVTKIEFQTWEYFSEDDFHYYECVPFSLFFEHIAPCLRDNPHKIPITFDTYCKPEDEVEELLVFEWEYYANYHDTDIYTNVFVNPRPLHDLDTLLDIPEEPKVCLDWKAEIGATELRGWTDQTWDLIE